MEPGEHPSLVPLCMLRSHLLEVVLKIRLDHGTYFENALTLRNLIREERRIRIFNTEIKNAFISPIIISYIFPRLLV